MSNICLVTGAGGLIGSEAARYFAREGYTVVGIDNNMRMQFFGPDADTTQNMVELKEDLGDKFIHKNADIRDEGEMAKIFDEYGTGIKLIVHCAAQPSHDFPAKTTGGAILDFDVNARATLILLENTRHKCPFATFIFCSTNKVYGDNPNRLPLYNTPDRWELAPGHPYYMGIDETMSIDFCKHSIFGASKVSADIMVQEYGRYFGMNTGVFRGGCLTGKGSRGAELHGFLAYLGKCVKMGRQYTIFGYGGTQVRDNIHSSDVISAFAEFHKNPRPGEVYNIGGGRFSNCSMVEAIRMFEDIFGKKADVKYNDQNRSGDHIWWISSMHKFKTHYPKWIQKYNVRMIAEEIASSQK